jgi:hypothetical protein
MTKPAGDLPNGPAPTPRPRTPALVRRGVAAIALGLAGCGGGDPVPPQVIPPQAPPPDMTAPPPQVAPPQVAPPPPQVAPPQVAPPPNHPSPAPPNAR